MLAKVEGHEFDLQKLSSLSLLEEKDSQMKVRFKNEVFEVRLINEDYQAKKFDFKINGFPIQVTLLNELEQTIEELGLNKRKQVIVNHIVAPMPGLVLDIQVNVGQTIGQGEKLLILEAMKMENVIQSSSGGVIKTISVKPGDKVEKGQILVELD